MPQKTYTYKSPKTGKSHTVNWNKPEPPTKQDFDALSSHYDNLVEEPKEKGALGKAWERANTSIIPPKYPELNLNDYSQIPGAIKDVATNYWDAITKPAYRGVVPSMERGAKEGIVEGVKGLATPLNAADALTGFGKAPALRLANMGISAATAAGGIQDISEGSYGRGGLEVAMGLLGLRGRGSFGPIEKAAANARARQAARANQAGQGFENARNVTNQGTASSRPFSSEYGPQPRPFESGTGPYKGVGENVLPPPATVVKPKLLGPAGSTIPSPGTNKFIAHPTGKVANAFDINTPETLRALDADITTKPPSIRGDGNPASPNALPPVDQLPQTAIDISRQRGIGLTRAQRLLDTGSETTQPIVPQPKAPFVGPTPASRIASTLGVTQQPTLPPVTPITRGKAIAPLPPPLAPTATTAPTPVKWKNVPNTVQGNPPVDLTPTDKWDLTGKTEPGDELLSLPKDQLRAELAKRKAAAPPPTLPPITPPAVAPPVNTTGIPADILPPVTQVAQPPIKTLTVEKPKVKRTRKAKAPLVAPAGFNLRTKDGGFYVSHADFPDQEIGPLKSEKEALKWIAQFENPNAPVEAPKPRLVKAKAVEDVEPVDLPDENPDLPPVDTDVVGDELPRTVGRNQPDVESLKSRGNEIIEELQRSAGNEDKPWYRRLQNELEGIRNTVNRLEGSNEPQEMRIPAKPQDIDSLKETARVLTERFHNLPEGSPAHKMVGKALNGVMNQLADAQRVDSIEPQAMKVSKKKDRVYEDLTPERYKRYHVYDANDKLIEKTYDYEEAHRLADESDGGVRDMGEVEPQKMEIPNKGKGQNLHLDDFTEGPVGEPARTFIRNIRGRVTKGLRGDPLSEETIPDNAQEFFDDKLGPNRLKYIAEEIRDGVDQFKSGYGGRVQGQTEELQAARDSALKFADMLEDTSIPVRERYFKMVKQLHEESFQETKPDWMKRLDGPQKMEVKGKKEGNTGLSNVALGGADARVWDVVGSSLYSNDRPTTVSKELMQNAGDEHKELGITEPIRVLFNDHATDPRSNASDTMKSVTVRDRGRGLTPNQIYTVLSDLGKSGKGGVESAAGGFGFAKAAPFTGGQYVQVRSVVADNKGNKVMYTFEGDPQQLKNQGKGVPLNATRVADGIPTGLEVTTYYEKKQSLYSARKYAKNMAINSSSMSHGAHIADVEFDRTPNEIRAWLDESITNPVKGRNRIQEMDAETHHPEPIGTHQGSVNTEGAKINFHYDIDPSKRPTTVDIHYNNKGMYQGEDFESYGGPTKNAPSRIVADIIATVEEGEPGYPFTANREQLDEKVTAAISKWVSENVISGVKKDRVKAVQKMYDGIQTTTTQPTNTGKTSTVSYLDESGKLTQDELDEIHNDQSMMHLTNELTDLHNELMDIVDSLGWKSENWGSKWKKPSERLKKFGFLYAEPEGSGTTLGIHIPRPDDMDDSAILINIMEQLNLSLKQPAPIDNISTSLLTTLIHEYAHVPGGGHDEGHSYRDAELHSRLGEQNNTRYLNKIKGMFDDGYGNVNQALLDVLSIYNQSRGRTGSDQDALSKIGINAKRPNDKPTGKAKDAASFKSGEGQPEAVEQPPNWGGRPKTVKIGKGVKEGSITNPPLNPLANSLAETAPVKPGIAWRRDNRDWNEEIKASKHKMPPIVPDVEPITPTAKKEPVARDVVGTPPPIKTGQKKLTLRNPSADEIKLEEANGWSVVGKDASGNVRMVYTGIEPPPETAQTVINKRKNRQKKEEPKTVTGLIKEKIRKSDKYKAYYEPIGVSNSTRLQRMGEPGQRLAKVVDDEITESNRYAGEHIAKIEKVIEGLSKEENVEAYKILDGQKGLSTASSPEVRDAVRTLRVGTNELGSEAVRAGVRMYEKGESVPFRKHDGEYAPHHYPEELFNNPTELRARLLRSGKSATTVDAIMKAVSEGERFSSPQHSREFDLPGYKEDLSVFIKHAKDMAQAITRAKRYGPKDVSDPKSIISQMIDDIADPAEAKEAADIVTDYLNKKENETGEYNRKAYEGAVNWTAKSKLSQQAITNFGDYGALSTALGVRNTIASTFKTLGDWKGSKESATRSGGLNLLKEDLMRETGGGRFGKWTGANATERFMRVVGHGAGKMNAEQLFEKAKKDPQWAKTLQQFVDGDVDEVLKQDSLTEKQLDFAGGRAVELSSGLPGKTSTSKAFYAKNPLLRLPFLLKRFAFLNVRNVAKAIKSQPTKAGMAKKLAVALAAYNVMGEATGDTKALIKGILSGDVEKSIMGRGDYISEKHPWFGRIMANWMQAGLFGIMGDVSERVVGSPLNKVTGGALGPLGSDIDELASVSMAATKGNFKPILRSAVRRIPFAGPGLAEHLRPD